MQTLVVTGATAGVVYSGSTTQLLVKSFQVEPLASNTGAVYIGGADVNSTVGSPLLPGQNYSEGPFSPYQLIDLHNDFHWTPSVNGEGIRIIYQLPTP